MGITIRHATIDDAKKILDLYAEYNRDPDPRPAAESIKRIFESIAAAGYIAAAESNGTLIGTYTMYICASLAHGGKPFAVIENVIVSAESRRMGIGRKLMDHAQDSARQAGCYKVMLSTGAGRPRNLQFYEACGFKGDKVGYQVRF